MSGRQNKQALVHKDKSAMYGEGFHALCAADFPHIIGRQCVLLKAILSTAKPRNYRVVKGRNEGLLLCRASGKSLEVRLRRS